MPKPRVQLRRAGANGALEVEALLASLRHPKEPEIRAARSLILGADPRVGESVKWNAPSFGTTEHFATFQLRARDGVQVVLHLGAKPRPDAGVRAAIVDSAKLLEWRGPDRATVTFHDMADVEMKAPAFVALVRQWITFVV